MALYLPISSHGLRRLTVTSYEGELRGATLFPFFDREGKAPRVIVLAEGSSEIRVFDPRETPLRFRFWRRLNVEGNFRRITRDDLRLMSGLWHFDPWWLLAEPGRSEGEIAALVKQTNCFGKLCDGKKREVKKLYFGRDLTRVLWAEYRKKGQSGMVSFSKCALPSQPAPRLEPGTPRQAGWRLDPFWNRATS
jgi:hypothetical protein